MMSKGPKNNGLLKVKGSITFGDFSPVRLRAYE